MNYFEDTLVSFYKYELNKISLGIYGDGTVDRIPICTAYCDIQPATNNILDKDFGKIDEAKYILWAEHTLDNQIEKDTLVLFEHSGNTFVGSVIALKNWEDYTEFVVKETPPSFIHTDKITRAELPDTSEIEGRGIYG